MEKFVLKTLLLPERSERQPEVLTAKNRIYFRTPKGLFNTILTIRVC
jgi:hypothetical protein